jgi:uncharacterized membrane protein
MTRSGGRRCLGIATGAVAVLALSACVVDVGTPGGYPTFNVWDVNASGTILANGNVPPADMRDPGTTQMFILDADDQWIPLRPATSGASPDQATAINDAGTVVGTTFIGPGEPACAFRLTPGQEAECIDDMQTVAHLARPNDINNHDTMVGSGADRQLGGPIPVLWTPAGGTTALPRAAGDTVGEATAVNEAGQIVGVLGPDFGHSRAVMWCPPKYKLVELPESAGAVANAIDAHGVVLGARFNAATGAPETILWNATRAHNVRVLPEGRAADFDGSGAPVGWVTRDGLMVAARFDSATLQPQVLGPADGRESQAVAAAGTQIVGTVSTGSEIHVARFVGTPT